MKKEFTYTTTINGNKVTLNTTLEITQEEIEKLFSQKQQQFMKSMNLNQEEVEPEASKEEFSYENYSSEDQDCCNESSYTPYSASSSQQEATASKDPKGYTPYASLQPKKDFPKSYHVELENGYAPYSTWRVNVPCDKKIVIE